MAIKVDMGGCFLRDVMCPFRWRRAPLRVVLSLVFEQFLWWRRQRFWERKERTGRRVERERETGEGGEREERREARGEGTSAYQMLIHYRPAEEHVYHKLANDLIDSITDELELLEEEREEVEVESSGDGVVTIKVWFRVYGLWFMV